LHFPFATLSWYEWRPPGAMTSNRKTALWFAGLTRIERCRPLVEDVSENLIDAPRGDRVVDFPIGASFDHCAEIGLTSYYPNCTICVRFSMCRVKQSSGS
jgi:predicted small integral membrane protein